jgi:tetratricopeptide (TPR) repeat protein
MNSPAFVQSQMLNDAHKRLAAGDAPGAAGIYAKLLKQQPADPMLLYYLGTSHRAAGNLAEARRHLEKAVRLRPQDVGFLHDLALVAKRESRFEEAHRLFDRGLKIRPDDQTLLGSKIDCYFLMGNFDAAKELLLPLIESGDVDISVAMAFARLSSRIGQQGRAAEVLEQVLRARPFTPAARIEAQFRLGELLDGLGEYERAFAHYRAANESKHLSFDPEAYSNAVDDMLRVWSPRAFAELPRASGPTQRAVFIVGMPRSGTTLVEQILDSHPAVAGGGELSDIGRIVHELQGSLGGAMSLLTDLPSLTSETINRRSREYLAALQRVNRIAERVTDKTPLNAMHLGFISVILPKARIIHCIRDVMDTCLSCYFQHFGSAMPFVYDLRHVGLMYRQYHRVMQHWKDVLKIPMLDVVYEELVDDQLGGTRRMLEFLGLPWDDACLKFHESKRVAQTASNDQVRRPIYKTSKQRWRNYERHLGPLKEALGDLLPADAR